MAAISRGFSSCGLYIYKLLLILFGIHAVFLTGAG
jgi:hypothetical protein